MKFLQACKLATVFILLTPTAYAGEKVDQQLDADMNGVVEIDNVRGKIKILGWDKEKVSVKGELDDQTKKFIFTNDGKVTVIRIELPDRVRRGDGSDLTIRIPKQSEVNFNGVSTDIIAEDILGGARIATVSGDIKLNKIAQQVRLTSVSGEISLKDSSGRLVASTVSGDIDIQSDSDDIELESVSADIKFKSNKEVQSLKVNTVSGEADLNCSLSKRGDVKLSSVSGDIALKLSGDVDARFNLTTAPGGEIENTLSEDKPKRSFISSQDLRFKQGEGSALVKGNTVSGQLTIKKSKN